MSTEAVARQGKEYARAEGTVVVGVGAVTPEDVLSVARRGAGVTLSEEALHAMSESRVRIERLAEDPTPVYGVSTGFGAL
ncbi:MAG: aromatic amino acid lyase, partial [Rhodococcus sp. (in: high G+C Gram-positive bacteria)]